MIYIIIIKLKKIIKCLLITSKNQNQNFSHLNYKILLLWLSIVICFENLKYKYFCFSIPLPLNFLINQFIIFFVLGFFV